jgi:hypothetical protein
MIDPFDISSNDADRVGERSRIPPYEFNEFNGAPYRQRATLRYRLRSGNAFSMILLVDHFLYGLSLDSFNPVKVENPELRGFLL